MPWESRRSEINVAGYSITGRGFMGSGPLIRNNLVLQYKRTLKSIDEIHNRIAPEIKMFPAKTQIINPNAYESYLKERPYFSKLSREGFWKALECFKAAIAWPAFLTRWQMWFKSCLGFELLIEHGP
jgi:hypothetical protein